MRSYACVAASRDVYALGEGPVWDPVRGRVLWVDIENGQILEGIAVADWEAVERTHVHQFDGTVGAAVPARDGSLLVAEQEVLTVVSPRGVRTPGPRVVPVGTASRLNDGKCDPAGRFVIGTLALDERERSEGLFQLRNAQLLPIDTALTLSNGLAWSPAGDRFFQVDTIPGVVWSRSYDPATGNWDRREVLLTITEGSPDGMCMDVDGNLWIAIWGAGQVRCFSPLGEMLAIVDVPAPHTTSVAFVGDDLDVLMITSARTGLSREDLRRHPDSGRVFLARVGVCGVPVPFWAG